MLAKTVLMRAHAQIFVTLPEALSRQGFGHTVGEVQELRSRREHLRRQLRRRTRGWWWLLLGRPMRRGIRYGEVFHHIMSGWPFALWGRERENGMLDRRVGISKAAMLSSSSFSWRG